jgi:preprotein translocase subunit SecE
MSADNTVDQKQGGRRRRLLGGRSREEIMREGIEVDESTLATGKGRATPSRRQQEEEVEQQEEGGNFIQRLVRGLRDYFKGVRSELDKVVWPTREDIIRLTIIVLTTLVVSAIVLGAIVLGFTELFRIGINQPAVLFGFIAIALVVGVVVARFFNRQAAE